MTIQTWLLDATRWAAIFAGAAAAGMWSGLMLANWRHTENGIGRLLSYISAGVVGLILFGLGRLVELIWYHEPMRLVGGPLLLVLYGLMDVGLYRAMMTTHLYATLKANGAVSATTVLNLKKIADQEHDSLQAQIDKLVEALERQGVRMGA